MRSVQPSQNDDFIATGQAIQGSHGERANLQPSIRSTFRTLLGCLAALLDFRADHPDRAKLKEFCFCVFMLRV